MKTTLIWVFSRTIFSMYTMKLFSAITGFLLLLSTGLNAQYQSDEVDFELGTPYEVVDAANKIYFDYGEYTLSVKIKRDMAVVQRINLETLSEISRNTLELPEDFRFIDIKKMQNKIVLFFRRVDKDLGIEQLWVKEINPESGEWIGKEKVLVKFEGKIPSVDISFGYKGLATTVSPTFFVKLSPDATKILVYHKTDPVLKNNDKNFEKIGLYVFDDNYQRIQGDVVRMPHTESQMRIEDYHVNNKGYAYIIAAVGKAAPSRGGKTPTVTYNYQIFKKRPSSSALSSNTISVDLGTKSIKSVSFYNDAGGDLQFVGSYGLSDKPDVYGLFSLKVDKNGDKYDEEYYAIPKKIINQYASERAKEKNEKAANDGLTLGLKNMYVREIIKHHDGSLVFICENRYSIVTVNTDLKSHKVETSERFYYRNLLMAKVDKSGRLIWMSQIPKRLISPVSVPYNTYKYGYKDGKHYVLFVENLGDKDKEPEDPLHSHFIGKHGVLSAYIIDDRLGKPKKLSVFETKEVNGIKLNKVMAHQFIYLGNGQFVFEAYKKKKEDILVKLTFKQ